jgi:muramoyltetrapeptide carboxypeptidase
MRLLARLGDVTALPPKPLVGFSDLTALHLALQAAGRPSIHGPVVTQLGRAPDVAVDWLFTLLESGRPPGPLMGAETLVSGSAEGPLIGGNLAVLTRLVGTPFFPRLDGAVLLVEDVNERPYRLDRMWTHLKLAGAFDRVAGIALGRFTGCDEPDGRYTGAEVLRDLAIELGLPCALGFPVGHDDANFAMPLGVRANLDADVGTLTILESFTSDGRR